MDYKLLEERINKAIDVREKGNLRKSRELFKLIIDEIKIFLKTNSSRKLKYIYATAMGQYVIQHRLEAGEMFKKALELGRELLDYDRKNDLNNPLSIRAVSNTLLNLGFFEQAEEYLKEIIPLYEGNSARQGDVKSHLALCYFRTGRIKEAESLIAESLKEIRKNNADEKHVVVWYSYALLVKALIFNSQNKNKEAMSNARKALKLAKENNKVFRVKQAQEIIDFLKS